MWWASHADGCEMADECSDCDQNEEDCRKVLRIHHACFTTVLGASWLEIWGIGEKSKLAISGAQEDGGEVGVATLSPSFR